jgi:xylulokinase
MGIDVGTSSTKALLVDGLGEVLASARAEYPMYRPHPGWAENDPDDWLRAVVSVVSELLKKSQVSANGIRGLCIVAQRDPLVFLDNQYRVLRPSISWIDKRDLDETEAVYDRFGRARLLQTCGLVPIPGVALPVIEWVRKHDPQAWRATHQILTTKDYVLFRLTGRIATDTCTPSRTMLYDLRAKQWSDWICKEAGINVRLLPPIEAEPWDVWGPLTAEGADRLGLEQGTTVATGGGDDPSAALGAGAVETGDVAVGTGTASCWRIVTNSNEPDPQGRADVAPHLVANRYVSELIITGTGSSLRWFRDTFGASQGEGDPYERLIAEAAQAPVGANGLMFFPYLEGARAPHFIDAASGVFFGLRADHRRSHLIRAILEGIAFQYPPVIDLLHSYTPRMPAKLTLVDDEAASALWNQIKADVCACPIQTLQTRYGAALGAAIIASQAAGTYKTAAEAVSYMVRQDRVFEPNARSHAEYESLRGRYGEVFKHLAGAYSAATRPSTAAQEVA